MLRKGSTPSGSRNNLSDDEFDPISMHSYGQSSKSGACSAGASSSATGGAASKNEEDRHRRTIIIEKKHNSYGFSLQSYGIHYKTEQELEMLTYVDHVEYDGPAYKSGMREGDVILSINGVDMEKADHARIVSFVKDCDTRMRMVVLFEDCVRKVSLHMRYIHLQNLLQTKVKELEALLQREREILEGKWKTHSLPARKKAASSQIVDGANGNGVTSTGSGSTNGIDDIYPKGNDSVANGNNSRRALASKTNTLPITRTAISTENMGKLSGVHGIENFTPNAQVLLSYQYMDPTSRSNLKSSNSSGIDSTDYLNRGEGSTEEGLNYYSLKSNTSNKSDPNLNNLPRSNCSTLSKDHGRDHQENPHQSRHAQYYSNLQENQEKSQAKEPKIGSRCKQSYYCNPCMGGMKNKDPQNAAGGGDNVSLDAYDLAGSPSMCCDPIHQCVPIRRRRSRHHHHHHNSKENHHHQQTHQAQQPPSREQSVVCQEQQQQQQQHKCHHHHHQGKSHKHTKHGSKCGDDERPQRPKSQSNLPSTNSAGVLQYQKTHTRYYDLTGGGGEMASRCSLHSCSQNDCCASTATTGSYCTSLSADTLNDWQDQDGLMVTPNHSGKNVKMIMHAPQAQNSSGQFIGQQQQQYQQTTQPHSQFVTRFYHHTVQIQPTDYQYQQSFMQKPKSWDNLSSKAVGGYAFGYGYISAGQETALKPHHGGYGTSHQQQQQPQAIDPHSVCGGYRVHPQQQPPQQSQQPHHMTSNANPSNGGSCNNSVNRKSVYQHFAMKGAATNTENAYGTCQHVATVPQQQQQQMSSTTTTTTIITSSTAHNNSKAMDSSGNIMMTKCPAGSNHVAGCANALNLAKK